MIFLCGLPRAGKSTVGRLVADTLSIPFFDTDRMLENDYAQKQGAWLSCRDIFQREGSSHFRKLETSILCSLPLSEKAIVALGGGIFELQENFDLVSSSRGCVIYLEASIPLIWERLAIDKPPPYLDPDAAKESFYRLALLRIPHYQSIAHHTINTSSLSLQGIAQRVVTLTYVS